EVFQLEYLLLEMLVSTLLAGKLGGGVGGGSSSVNVGEHFLEWVIHHTPHLKCTADKSHIPITYDPPPPRSAII
ncbi:MAG: hypothetical protein ACPIOQ_77440, partial [Promethearchaeia archaeon]